MNDVKISNVDFGAKARGPNASSSSPEPVRDVQDSRAASEQLKQQEVKRLQAQEQAEKQVEANQKAVEDAVTRLNDYVQTVQRDLRFQLDNDSGKTIITVVDSQTSEVVRQIPDDVALRLARDLQQDEPLSLFNAKV